MAKPKIKCAFCHNEANSGEHIWDNWINEELPKTRYDAKKRIADLSPIQFVTVGLNEKLLAVCDKCNGGWMSALTAKVKKHFSEAIFNGAPVSIAPRDATILANFTFMKATVHDYFFYSNKPFFTGDIRKRLKMSLTIPSRARMQLAAHQGDARYSFVSNFYRVGVNMACPLYGMEFFCYTYTLGKLVIQLVAPRWKDVRDWNRPLVALAPNKFWQSAAIRFWPYIREVHWPPAKYLGDDIIEKFINRFDAPIELF